MWEAVEGWTLLLLSAFQALVAFEWRGAPWPRRVKWAVLGLFGLNAAAFALNGLSLLGYLLDATFVATYFDRWTNFFLLALPLAAMGLGRKARGFALTLLVFAAAATSVEFLSPSQRPAWSSGLVEVPLLLAMPATAIAMRRQLMSESGPSRTAWILILAVLGMRFAELSSGSLAAPGTSPLPLAIQALRLVGFISMVALVGSLLQAKSKYSPGKQAGTAAVLLILAGFLVGGARAGIVIPSAVVFSLGAVRPVVFMVALSILMRAPAAYGPSTRRAVMGAALMLVSLAGFLLGEAVWGLAPSSSGMLGIALPLLTFPAVAWAYDSSARPVDAKEKKHLPGQASQSKWGLDDRVPLPQDWQAQLESSKRAYEELPRPLKERLARLARWERILLALDAAAETPRTAYERTTPGLHLATQCPYSAIGSEIARCNARWEAILENLHIPGPRLPVDPSQSLIRGTWGRAEGLRSERVKSYELTPLGSEVAAALRRSMGIDNLQPISLVVGEALGGSKRHPMDSEVVQR